MKDRASLEQKTMEPTAQASNKVRATAGPQRNSTVPFLSPTTTLSVS